MRSNWVDSWALVFLAMAVSLPFFNYARYVPAPDWWTDAAALFMLVCGALLGLLSASTMAWPRASIWALVWWLACFVPIFVLRFGNVYQIPLSETFGILWAIVAGSQFYALEQRLGRPRVVTVLAICVLIVALMQAFIGFEQLMGLALLANGYFLFNGPGDIMGNFGQRNQFAQFLSWGIIAAQYLMATRKLNIVLSFISMTILSVVVAWSGGRLPLAYAVTMVLFATVWYRKNRDVRLLSTLIAGAVLILVAQLFGHHIAQWITGHEVNSGLDRINDAGFGGRRRVEWTKAWQIAKAYPWFGVGFGGYAYQSVWLEAFAGLPKIPENTLFTHSHNLITQLLAETGVPATLLAATGVVVAMLPYFRREQATSENAFLVLIAAAILGHSMFEYPMWYMPFLVMFFIVLMLSPQGGLSIPVRPMLRKLGVLVLVVATFAYLVNGASVFNQLRFMVVTTTDVKLNEKNMARLLQIAPNPFWSYEAESLLANYMQPSRQDLQLKRRYYEQLAAYRPYPLLLCNLAMLRTWSGDQAGAQNALIMALATYPANSPQILWQLKAAGDPALQPLEDMANKSAQTLAKHGDQAVVEAVTKGLPVRGPQIPDLSRFR
ncbi:PglL family O-oligosaccharyltransferase [Vogesella sp. LIG4]|uniref:PglL family O-oligosaccharyltransferase n=1 Tax=Vogesella sp. LIG4 TaxID=1192162 RepID=UPI00081FA09B|nr:O-antigen ligase family protein [Vogesella sp. LIG4]SCK14901.1 Lipid A core-O-antigen ligase and related enzymes [Vogesella sp. LIG4]